MASIPVNPQLPDVQPSSYLGYSQGVSPIGGNNSAGVALAGFGNALQSGLKGADEVVRATIDQALYQGVDKEREGFTGALEQVAGVPQENRVADYQPDLTTQDVGGPIPQQLQTVDRSVSNLQGGLSNGKFSATYYTGRLDVLAKDLRNQYPGYRDYIDQKISQVTGGNPANEYIKQLLTSINTGIANNRSETDKALTLLGKEDIQNMPGLNALVQQVASGQAGPNPQAYVIQQTSKWRGIDADFKRRAAIRADLEGQHKLDAQTAEQDLVKVTGDILGQGQTVLHGGLGTVGTNQLAQLVSDINNGKTAITAEQGVQLSQSAHVYYSNMYNTAWAKANESVNGAPSLVQTLGAEKAKQVITDSLSPLQTVLDNIDNKAYGSAHIIDNANTAITNDSTNQLFNSSDTTVKTFARNATALNKLGGQALVTVTKDWISDGLPAAIRTVIQKQKAAIGAQPDQGKVHTLQEAIEQLQKGNVGGTDPAKKTENKAYESITNLPSVVANPAVANVIKQNIIQGSYGTGNEGLIYKFSNDGYNEKGEFVPGRHAVFNKMTQPDIAQAAYKLGGDSWKNYKNWTEANHAQLFGQDIRDLNTLSDNPNIKFTFDNQTHHIGIDLADTFFVNPYTKTNVFTGNQNTSVQDTLAKQYRAKVAEINSGIDSVTQIAKLEGKDPNAYILNLLQAQNLDLNNLNLPGAKIARAVASTQKPDASGKLPNGKYADGQPSLTNPQWTATPGAAFDNMLKGIGRDYVFPVLKDLTGLLPSPPTGTVGGANAAHISADWGNPLAPSFKQDHLTDVQTPDGKSVTVNKKAAEAFKGFLSELEASGYKINSLGGYNLREKKGSGGISQHAFGNAIDINPDQNPYVGNPLGVGKMKTNLPENISQMAAKYGISWGGDWSSVKDPMHFEFTGKMPAQRDRGYSLAKQ